MQVDAKVEKGKARLILTAENEEDREVFNQIAREDSRFSYRLYGKPDGKLATLELDFKK